MFNRYRFIGTLSIAFVLAFGRIAHAQTSPIPTLQSPAAGEGYHIFSGTTPIALTITCNAGTGARYLMLFDATALPANGSTTSCTSQGTSPVTGCLAYCMYVPNSTSAPNVQTWDWIMHPIQMRFGTVAALSTGAGCGTLTVDTGVDWFYGQIKGP